jgi:hypothetical protein
VRLAERARLRGGALEAVDVAADVLRQDEQAVAQNDRLRTQNASRCVQRLVQVVLCRGCSEVGPEQLHRLLTMQTPARRERERLHERPRLAQAPGAIVDLGAVDDGAETPEQLERDVYRSRSQSRSSV